MESEQRLNELEQKVRQLENGLDEMGSNVIKLCDSIKTLTKLVMKLSIDLDSLKNSDSHS